MDAVKDHYKTLELQPSATPEEVKAAYRRLAKQWHPDRHHGSRTAVEKMTEINEAYSVLFDPLLRARYDKRASQVDLFDLVNQMFGGALTPQAASTSAPTDRWSDPLADQKQKPKLCPRCQGRKHSFMKQGMVMFKIPCAACSGKGYV